MEYRPDGDDGIALPPSTGELAGRGARLGAWLIDIAIYLTVMIVVGFIAFVVLGVGFGISDIFGGLFAVSFTALLAAMMLPIFAGALVFIVQMTLLAARGQTIGKMALNIRIVDAQTGEHPGWVRLILLRSIVNGLIIVVLNLIPVIGQGLGGLYFIVDSLFIFREDRRTIHDMIAGTRVDKVGG